MADGFGALLKDWRAQRRMSQLDLGLAANVSARHVSFLETGRSSPSRAMVFQIAETLDLPRPARNDLLVAAGFAPAFRARDLADEDMREIRAALDWMLERHQPFPGVALDRHWTALQMNASAAALFEPIGIGVGDSIAQAIASDPTFGGVLENWREVAAHMIARLKAESQRAGGDPFLDEIVSKLRERLGSKPLAYSAPLPAVAPAVYRLGHGHLRLFTTIAQFGSAEDIALADIKVELLFPADEPSRAFFMTGALPTTADC